MKKTITGIHIDFHNNQNLDFKQTKLLIRKLSQFGVNTIVIEYGNKFSFKFHPDISSDCAFTKNEVRQIVKICKDNNIQTIPLLQCFGHVDYIVSLPKYIHLSENENNKEFCPLKKDSFKLFTDMAEEIIDIHRESKYFHIGGDETRDIGTCSDCKKELSRITKGQHYTNHINKICDFIKQQNKIPILWDDILCTYPDSLDYLDKNAIIMYWDYWATKPKIPFFVCRYSKLGIIYDNYWRNNDELKKIYLPEYAKNKYYDLNSLNNEFKKTFKKYITGKDFPKYIKSLPYLEFYQDKGFEVIIAPSIRGNGDVFGKINYLQHISNIIESARRIQETNGLGIVTTTWGNFSLEQVLIGYALTGFIAKNPELLNNEQILINEFLNWYFSK